MKNICIVCSGLAVWIVRFVFVSIPFFTNAQVEIPGEYILSWKNAESARKFANSLTAAKGNLNYKVNPILYDKVVLDHVLIPPSACDFYEKLWKSNPDILFFQKNRIIEERIIPDDPNFPQQWQYINDGVGGVSNADLDMELAWDVTTGGLTVQGDTIVICVIDEGVNIEHPDLKPNLWINRGEIPGNGIDDDNNGYVDDYRGWNIVTGDDNLSEGGSHGTPVCGIVGAKGNNNTGVSGVNWNVKVMFVKYGSATEANALASYAYAYTMRKLYNETNGEKGAFIVVTNASWGVNEVFAEDAPLWCNMYDLLGEVGILNCGATANSEVNVDVKGDMPTSCGSEFLISVTNLNRSDLRVTGSAFGRKSIDLGAYGHQTYTISRTNYGPFGGTSAATPHVAGTVALMYAVPCPLISELSKTDPSKAALVVKDMLLHGSVANASLSDITTTGGRLNANNAVRNAESLCATCAPPAGIIIKPRNAGMTITWQNPELTGPVSLRYRKSEDINWTNVSAYQIGSSIEGLDYCTEYELQLAVQCFAQPLKYSYSKFFLSGGCCPVPDNFTTFYLGNSMTVNWTSKETDSVQYYITCRDYEGNIVKTILDTNSWTMTSIDSCRWFNLTIEAQCPVYGTIALPVKDIIVNSPCGACTDKSYCAFSRKNTQDEWIESVEFGSLFNESGINKNGYGNYLGAVLPVYHPDSSYVLKIVPGFSSSPFTEDYSIYIDYNQDGEFGLAEKIWNQRTAATHGISTLITIPSGVKEGITRMRVIMAFQSHDSPCDKTDFEYGEIEDYCIRITNILPYCRLAGGIVVDSTGENMVSVVFEKLDSAASYIILLRRWDSHTYDTIRTTESPLIVTGLDSCRQYYLKIAPDCNVQPYYFSDEISFISPCRSSGSDEAAFSGHVIFPNPFRTRLDVFFEDRDAPEIIYMKDVLGREVSGTTEKKTGLITLHPDETLPGGIYFLFLQKGNRIATYQVVKL